jgi:hypothetical protein
VCNLTSRTATYWTTQEAANSSDEAAKGCQGKINMRQIQRKGAAVDIADVSGRVYHLRMEEEETGRLLEDQFRTVAVSALENAKVHGGDALTIEKKELGRAEMEAMAPYLRDSTRLRMLVLSGAGLGKDGVGVLVQLVQALETNTTVTALDLSNNDLKGEGARAVAELLARCVCGFCVCGWVGGCVAGSPHCANFILCPAHHIRHYTGATMGIKHPQRQPHGITHGDTPGNASDVRQHLR